MVLNVGVVTHIRGPTQKMESATVRAQGLQRRTVEGLCLMQSIKLPGVSNTCFRIETLILS